VKIECLNHWHDVSPTGLAVIVQAFQDGDLHRTVHTTHGMMVEPICVLEAFGKERVEDFLIRYHGHTISVDSKTYERMSNGKAQQG